MIKGFERDVGTKTSFYGFTVNTMKNSLISYSSLGFTSVPQGQVRPAMGEPWWLAVGIVFLGTHLGWVLGCTDSLSHGWRNGVKVLVTSWVWWRTPLIPAFPRQRQADLCEFLDSQGLQRERPCLKQQSKKNSAP